LLNFSKTLGSREKETKQVRWASTSKPSLGGFSFYALFIGSLAVIGLLDIDFLFISKIQIIGIFIATTLGFFVGFADDTYNTNPALKFIGQFLCSTILFFSDVQISILEGYPIINFLFTLLWVAGLMNSVNMLDNMDGITSSSSALIIVGLLVFLNLRLIKDDAIQLILISVLAALVGFLFYNWFPAKMYMGDTGSQFLGVFLSAFSIILIWNERQIDGNPFQVRQFMLPLILFIVPLTDTITVFIRRIMKKQSPFIGGKDHTTHHLVYFGLKERNVAFVLIAIGVMSNIIVVFLAFNSTIWTSKITFLLSIYFLLIFISMQIVYQKGLNNINNKQKSPAFKNINVESEVIVE
jgi:UDP-GlcNAc:undecaprenyl-phosphate GlcNAc-1-phosphate transferase